MIYEYLEERDTPFIEYFELLPDWLFQYFKYLPLGESIKIAYLVLMSELHRLTSKNKILHSLVPFVKKYFVTMEEDGNKLKTTYQCCICFVICSVRG